jgi:hypothetical protein
MSLMEWGIILAGILLGMLLAPLYNSTVGTYVTALKAS